MDSAANLELIYSEASNEQHRSRYGQFFTPGPVAEFMCRWVMSDGASHVFDPAFGLGAFARAALSIAQKVSFTGMEIDGDILAVYRAHHRCSPGSEIECGDYLDRWGMVHQAIVCNPPYIRFQRFPNRDKIRLSFRQALGIDPSGYTNVASAFLLKSLSELAPNGRLAYIMPHEFLGTGYGELVKSELLRGGRLKAILRLACEKEVFPTATTSVCIVLCSRDEMEGPVRFANISDLDELSAFLDANHSGGRLVAQPHPTEKWLKFFEPEQRRDESVLVPLSTYGRFSRGIATGANEFFVMSPSRARSLRLPSSVLRPCLTKSAQVPSGIFSATDFHDLVGRDESVFLLDANGCQEKAVRDYICSGEREGFHERFLTKNRRPWYALEKRGSAPLLFSVFSRGKYKVVLNRSEALNLTCFHGFYPDLFGIEFVEHLYLYFQSRAAQAILGDAKRCYGDGLDKLEPNDLNRCLVPAPEWFGEMPRELLAKGLASRTASGSDSELLDSHFESLLA